MKPTLIVFHSPNIPLVYKFDATDIERNLLSDEIALYNDWIGRLFDGTCPESAYSDPKDADQWYLARRMNRNNDSYNGEFERPGNRGFYEVIPYDFDIYMGDEDECIELVEDINSVVASTKNYEVDTFRSLKSIILGKLGEEFGLGYRLFPIIKRIIERNK